MFLPNGKTRKGLRPECRTCTKKRDRASYQNSRDRHLAYSRKRQSMLDDETRARYAGAQRRRRQRDPEWRRQQDDRRRLRRYGLTVEEYKVLLAAQEGICAICGGPPTGMGKSYHVDHDHETGVVRGLLCSNCNTALGLLGDDPARLAVAINYLRDPPVPRRLAAKLDDAAAA
jgi:hypothetical protein